MLTEKSNLQPVSHTRHCYVMSQQTPASSIPTIHQLMQV